VSACKMIVGITRLIKRVDTLTFALLLFVIT
jgi:hypothetical protein